MSVSFKLDTAFNVTGALSGALRAEAAEAVTRSATAAKDAAVNSLGGGRRGRVYRRKGGGTHRASAPGEPPATESGDLARSAKVESQPGDLSAAAVFDSDHALALEYGTKGGKVAARPFLTPAAEAQSDAFASDATRAVERAGRRIGGK